MEWFQAISGAILRLIEALISWPAAIVVIAWILRGKIGTLIERVVLVDWGKRQVHIGDKETKEVADRKGYRLEGPAAGGETLASGDKFVEAADGGDKRIMPSDVLAMFVGSIDYFDERNSLSPYLHATYLTLLSRGVTTVGELRALLNDEEALEVLGAIYREELLRPPHAPLDPVGIATYGPYLHRSACDPEIIEAIRRDVRNSPEYQNKHPGQGLALLDALRRRTRGKGE